MATKTNFSVNGNNYYRLTKTIGHKVVDGKKVPIRKQFIGTSKRNAEQKYEDWKEDQRRKNKRIVDSDQTFIEVADYYVDNILAVNSKYAASTIDLYTGIYKKHLKSALKDKPVSQITASDIQTMYNSLKISKSVMKTIAKFMSGLFKWLSANSYADNVLSGVIVPNKKDNSRHSDDEVIVWTDCELKKIADSLNNHRLRFFVLLCSGTGMRISEQFGLKYSDFSDDNVKIKRQYYKGELCKPKSNSVRTIPMSDMVERELQRHKQWHEEEMKKNGYNTDFVFTTKTGKLLENGNVRRSLMRFYNKYDIPYKTFHSYRATFCTNLCKAGVPIQTASKLMGHKSIEVTAKFYTSIEKSEKEEAISKLPDLTK